MATQIVNPTVDTPQPRLRLPYLDGIRGLAALLVVVNHLWSLSGSPTPFWSLVWIGHACVVVFITLSGYVLMLPVSYGGNHRMTDIWGFIKRRAKRILPPYYAALLLSGLTIWCLPSVNRPIASNGFHFIRMGAPGGMLYWKDVALHILLIHNISPSFIRSFDPPLWSIATEWQIYFVFALFLLPVLRRFGSIALLITGFAFVAFAQIYRFAPADPWLVGSFAIGMVAADLSLRKNIRKKYYLIGIVMSLILARIFRHLHFGSTWEGQYPLVDEFFALATGLTLVYMRFAPTSLANRFFGSKPLKVLGEFSYSLYVIHWPILVLITYPVPGGGRAYFLKYCLLLPVVLAIAYGFHLVFERPFMRWKNPA